MSPPSGSQLSRSQSQLQSQLQPSELPASETPKLEGLQHYAPDWKVLLIRLCVNNEKRYVEELPDAPFWQCITALLEELTGHQVEDVQKEVTTLVKERKAIFEDLKKRPGLVRPPVTDLWEAVDLWMEVCEHRAEKHNLESEGLDIVIKREKVIDEVFRYNSVYSYSEKRGVRAVLEARQLLDPTDPGDVVVKRCRTRRNPRGSRYDTDTEAVVQDMHRLTKALIDYMNKRTPSASQPSAATIQSPPVSTSVPKNNESITSGSPVAESTISSPPAPTTSELAELKAEVGSCNEPLQQLVMDKST